MGYLGGTPMTVPTTRLWPSVALGSLIAGCGTVPAKSGGPVASAAAEEIVAISKHGFPPVDGKQLEVELIEVRYGPGASSPPHRHPCAVVGYVLEGALRFAVDTDSARVYRASESFYEAPNALHRVSANASATDPVRFLVSFICTRIP